MKRAMSYVLAFLIASGVMMVNTTVYAEKSDTSWGSILECEHNQDILRIMDTDYDSCAQTEMLSSFVDNGGILIVEHTGNAVSQFDAALDVPLSVTASESDLVTIYYKYGDDLSGKYIITRGTADEVDLELLIDEAIELISQYQSDSAITTLTASESATSLGRVEVVATLQPKGKLRTRYEVYTVQNYHDRDFYIVKAFVSGIPGCVLADDDSDYKAAYQIENLTAAITASSDSVTIDAYGPYSTEKSDSYSVDLGISLDTDNAIQISGGFSYSRTIYYTDITTSATSKKVKWDVDINKSAQKTTFTFEPGVTFTCPSNKTQIVIDVSATCIMDAWYALEETIELSRTILCTPSGISDY